jgi:hypothetical protein
MNRFDELEAAVFAAAFYAEMEKTAEKLINPITGLITKIRGPGKIRVRIPKAITKSPEIPKARPPKVRPPKVKAPKVGKPKSRARSGKVKTPKVVTAAAQLTGKKYVEKGEIPALLKNIALISAGTGLGTMMGYGGRVALRRWASRAARSGNTQAIGKMLPLIGAGSGGLTGLGLMLGKKKLRMEQERRLAEAVRKARKKQNG